jgi:hypothetical protein
MHNMNPSAVMFFLIACVSISYNVYLYTKLLQTHKTLRRSRCSYNCKWVGKKCWDKTECPCEDWEVK